MQIYKYWIHCQKLLLSKLADSLHFPDEPEGSFCREVEYLQKFQIMGLLVCTLQCDPASFR